MSAPQRTAIVVSFDQLPAAILGCYGNEWIDTPHLDGLAARGVVADQCWSAFVDGTSADQAFSCREVMSALAARQVATSLLHEADARISFAGIPFQSVTMIDGETGETARPDRIPLARMVQAAQQLPTQDGSRLLWLHARGLSIPPAPPAGFAELYFDEFADRGVELDALSTADRAVHPSAFAGMVSLLDHWLGVLLEQIAQMFPGPQLIVVIASQGMVWQPLPNSFGDLDRLRSSVAMTPCVMTCRVPGAGMVPPGKRSSSLMSTADLGAWLESWFSQAEIDFAAWENGISQPRPAHHSGVITRCTSGHVRLSTAALGVIFPAAMPGNDIDPALRPVLFRKPEDYWDVNNLADIALDEVDSLRSRLPEDVIAGQLG